MTASATSLQNIPATGIFNPGAYEVNFGDASAALAEAGLDDGPIYAKPATIAPPSFLSAARNDQHPGQLLAMSCLLKRTRGRPQCDREPDVVPDSISSCAGPCVWQVVGLQRSLREWAMRQGWGGRPVRQEQAQGIMIAALGVLAAHARYRGAA